MSYGIASRDYLARARAEIASGDAAHLFYAAFELRCGVEARLQEYLEPHSHVPDGRKRDWQVARLGKTVQGAFGPEKVARVIIRSVDKGRTLAVLLYTPVTQELRGIADRLGDYLHAGKSVHPTDDPWWTELRTCLERGCDLLGGATTGTLLGPPLINKRTGQAHMPMELPAGAVAPAVGKGDEFIFEIRYADSLNDFG